MGVGSKNFIESKWIFSFLTTNLVYRTSTAMLIYFYEYVTHYSPWFANSILLSGRNLHTTLIESLILELLKYLEIYSMYFCHIYSKSYDNQKLGILIRNDI